MPLTAAECLRSTATPWGSSRWATHNRCGVEYDLRYNRRVYRLPVVKGITAAYDKPTPFHVGSLVHAGLRLVESGTMLPRDATAAVIDAAAVEGERFSRLDMAEAQRLLDAYWAHYGEENAGWPDGLTVIATELQLKATGLQHTGAIDTLLRDPSGGYYIVDTKTRAQRFADDADRTFATNPQFLSLSYMAQEHFDLLLPPPVIVNAIVKTKVPDFARPMVRFTQRHVDTWARNQADIEANRALLIADGAPTRNYNACAPAIGSKCDYFYFCEGSDEEKQLKYGVASAADADAEIACVAPCDVVA